MKNKYIVTCIILFFIITIFVLSSSDSVQVKRVAIKSQGIAISQQGTHIESEKANISNAEVKIEQENIDLNTQQTTYSTNQTLYKEYDTSAQKSSQSNYKQQTYDYSDIDSKLAKLQNIENTINRNKNNKVSDSYNYMYKNEKDNPNNDYKRNGEKHGYTYEDIDWNIWKSNFINRILDDSMSITSLNSYKIGTWFYYSFNVTNSGEIKDVTVRSFTLKEADKQEIKNMIYRYAHQNITVFPKNSKRKVAKIDAIMLLGETETKSKPEDFNDTEHIKIRY